MSEEGGELPMEETLLPPDVFIQAVKNLEPIGTDLRQHILLCSDKDSSATKALSVLLKAVSSTDK